MKTRTLLGEHRKLNGSCRETYEKLKHHWDTANITLATIELFYSISLIEENEIQQLKSSAKKLGREVTKTLNKFRKTTTWWWLPIVSAETLNERALYVASVMEECEKFGRQDTELRVRVTDAWGKAKGERLCSRK